jgi:uncharacterized membrane protein
LAQATASTPRPRIQGLSDLIFGLALSIGAIQLVGTSPQNNTDLLVSLSAFGFSFLILMNVWNRYTTIVSAVPVETAGMIRLNMLLLFFVAIEPYLFNLLTRSTIGELVSAYYAVDLGGMNLVLAYFAHLLVTTKKNPLPPEEVRRFRFGRNIFILVGLLFLVSASPGLWNPRLLGEPLRVLIWVLVFPIIWVSRLLGKQM